MYNIYISVQLGWLSENINNKWIEFKQYEEIETTFIVPLTHSDV